MANKKDAFELAANMFEVCKGINLETCENLCRRMQDYNKEVFMHLCNRAHSPLNFQVLAKKLSSLQPPTVA